MQCPARYHATGKIGRGLMRVQDGGGEEVRYEEEYAPVVTSLNLG
ncbi:MAG TPA: hypothetical protein VHU44_08130 [Acidobacteriaceae bacterium]|nr:hypothetical protein [Acidobacteriaceae bacterium]